MLEELNKINWNNLIHAYGPATDTPKQIRKLASSVAKKREEAYDALSYTIYHQGSVYSASIASVPFLAEILEEKSVKEKYLVLDLLSLLATGRSYHDVHQHFTLLKEESKKKEYQEKVKVELEWVEKLKKEINKHINVYLKFLDDDLRLNRLYACLLLSALPDLKEVTLPAMIKGLEQEKEEDVRAGILYIINELDRNNKKDFFKKAMEEEKMTLPLCVAMACYVSLEGKNTQEEVIELLMKSLTSINPELIKKYNSIPCTRDFYSDMAVPPGLAGKEYAEKILPWYTEKVSSTPFCMETMAAGLLTVALMPGKEKIPLENLTDNQKKAVLAIARKAWPKPNNTYVNMVDILRMFGLPDRENEMIKFLGMNIHKRNTGDGEKRPWWKI